MNELLPIDDDHSWAPWAEKWTLREGTTYLNHGSFGPPPESVRRSRLDWMEKIDAQPVDFFFRQLEPELAQVKDRLAKFVGTTSDCLACVDNATYAMNIVAESFPLNSGDEVLLTDHVYGAVHRIWRRACRRADACEPRMVELPLPIESTEQVVEKIFEQVGKHTKLLVVSHVTSATAVTLPVAPICQRARELGIAVCIDGPHALAQVPVEIDKLDCDFYAVSCHKWLSAPFGTGFLYVHPRRQESIEPPVLSWGRLLPAEPHFWQEEFIWQGSRDMSPLLAIPAAIDFLETVGLETFRRRTHFLAQHARERLVELTGMEPLVPDSSQWYGAMAHVPLPEGDATRLQKALWQEDRIEVPIVSWNQRRWIRVSCHLYNNMSQIDRLVEVLRKRLHEGA